MKPEPPSDLWEQMARLLKPKVPAALLNPLRRVPWSDGRCRFLMKDGRRCRMLGDDLCLEHQKVERRRKWKDQ